MKLKVALCALLLVFVTASASARFSEEDGWTGWDGWDDTNWGWDRTQEWNGESCPEKPNGGNDPKGVPSPTAALMGLGVMGLMLSRRTRRG